jgi:CelD/BcsL family acetyltransferase involved in cellulose biosynthesis
MPLDAPPLVNSFSAGIVCLENPEEAEALLPQWRALEENGTSTLFQSRAWLLPWCRLILPVLKARVIFVTVFDASNQPVMLLPLCKRRSFGLSIIEFADGAVADYAAPLLGRETGQAGFGQIWPLILDQLPKSDLIRFEKLPEHVSGRTNPVTLLPWVHKMDNFAAWGISLPASRADYDKNLRSRDRKEIRRKRKNLGEALGSISLVHANSFSEKRRIFDALRAQRQARFGKLKRSDILSDPHYLQFYEELVFGSGGATVSALMAGDKPIATMLGVYCQNAFLLLMHSFDSALESLSPGIVAIDEMTSHLIENGITHFDFTIGSEGYKKQFGVAEEAIYKGMLARSWKGVLYLFAHNLAHAAHKRLVRSAVYARLKRAG